MRDGYVKEKGGNKMNNNECTAAEKLLIIGNGFDRAHFLPTGYNDFKKYMSNLIRAYQGEEESEELLDLKQIPEAGRPKIYTKNGIIDDYGSESKIVYWLIDEAARKKGDINWGKFENYLGQLNIKKVLKKWGKNDAAVHVLRDSIDDIKGFFFEWINTIDLSVAQKRQPYLSVIDGKRDIAILFNYTETLETVYGMKSSNICYIHGQRETNPVLQQEKSMLPLGKYNLSLVVGFGSKYLRNKRQIRKKLLLMGLYKDTSSIIYEHKDFFNKVESSDIKEIYSLGFSFSDADMPYVNKVCNELNRKNDARELIWFITPYGKNRLKKMREELHMRKCIWRSGFRGKVRKM